MIVGVRAPCNEPIALELLHLACDGRAVDAEQLLERRLAELLATAQAREQVQSRAAHARLALERHAHLVVRARKLLHQ